MADLDSLNLNDEGISEDDFDKMPTGLGSFVPPPQPGTYVFQLPGPKQIFACFETIPTADQGQKIVAVFSDEAALHNETLGERYSARISNRTRFIKGEVLVSDMGMLLKAVDSKPEANPQGIITNAAYGKALIAAGGRRFKAEHSLTANCNETRDIYKDGKVATGQKGCARRYAVEGYQPKSGKAAVLSIPKDAEGKVAIRFECACGAELRCFGELRGYRSAD